MKKVVLSFSMVFSLLAFSLGVNAEEETSKKEAAKKLYKNLKQKVHKTVNKSRDSKIDLKNEDSKFVQCLADEMEYKKLEGEVLTPLKNSLKERKALSQSIFSENVRGPDYSKKNLVSEKNIENIHIEQYKSGKSVSGKTNVSNSFLSLRSGFDDLESVELVTTSFKSLPSQRFSNREMKSVQLAVNFDLRGRGEKDNLLQKRGRLLVNVKRSEKGGTWEINRVSLDKEEVLTTKAPRFENLTKESEVASNVPVYLRREAIRRGGYAMAVGEKDAKGEQELLVATMGKSILLKKTENGAFKRVQDQSNLENLSLVKSAAFADFNNDGTEEILAVRFAPNEKQSNEKRSDIQILYKNEEGVYEKSGGATFPEKTAYAMPLAIADYDQNGLLDFYVGFPGSKDFTDLSPNTEIQGLARQGIFYNEEKGNFAFDSEKSLAKAQKVSDDPSNIFPHSAIAADYDQNGTSDIVVIDDRGNLSPFYVNEGLGQFKSSAEKVGLGLKDYGMGADMGDLNGDGHFDFVMSSVNFHSSARVKKSCEMNWAVSDSVSAGVRGLRSFQGNENGTFTETTKANSLSFIGEGAGGVKLFDYNNDGRLDIYVVNGLWSGNSKSSEKDISHLFVGASHLNLLNDDFISPLRTEERYSKTAVQNNDYKSLLFRSDSQSAIMDILSYYREDQTGNEEGESVSLAGHQRNRLFHNMGDGQFVEVGYMLGVDSLADGYMPATMDLNQDGNLDLVLRNADPGVSKDQFAPVELFKNKGNANNSLTLKLVGTQSNKSAVGATVEAHIKEEKILRHLMGNSGTVQSERVLHIGMGDAKKIDKLKIMWPSGQEQILEDLGPGHKVIEESQQKIGLSK